MSQLPENFFTQAGMESTLRHFTDYQNQMQGTISGCMGIQFVGCSYADKTATFAFDVDEWKRNPGGVMHGGALSTALDIAMGSNTCYWAGCRLTPTVTLQMNFLRPIFVGSRLILKTQVHACGRTTAYATVYGWMEGKEDRSVVTGSGVYHVPAEHDAIAEVLDAAMAEIMKA